uniref:Uncharacterized protein n=1 Tax=Mus musculus TaxID=10090 RepID=Q3V1H2_MOUSE|nr:unnamed protein product [Mus musculus]
MNLLHFEGLAPGIFCSGPEFTETSGASTGGPWLLDPDGRHAGLDHGLHTLLPRRRGMRKVGGLQASFPFCLSCYVFIFPFIHLII